VKLRFTPRATANIAKIADYIRKRNPSAARRVRSSIYDSLQNLLLFPLIGRQQKEPGVRKHVTPRYAYLVYYTIDEVEEEIIILSVKHSAQEREHDDA
jgi:toxin ParE1/3/4